MNPLEAYLKDLPCDHPARVEYAKIVHQAEGLRSILSAAISYITMSIPHAKHTPEFRARLITKLQTAIDLLRPKKEEISMVPDKVIWHCSCGYVTHIMHEYCSKCGGARKICEVRP